MDERLWYTPLVTRRLSSSACSPFALPLESCGRRPIPDPFSHRAPHRPPCSMLRGCGLVRKNPGSSRLNCLRPLPLCLFRFPILVALKRVDLGVLLLRYESLLLDSRYVRLPVDPDVVHRPVSAGHFGEELPQRGLLRRQLRIQVRKSGVWLLPASER